MFPELPSVRRLVDRSRAILGSIFGTDDPAYAETNLSPDLFTTTVKRARRTIESDDGIRHA